MTPIRSQTDIAVDVRCCNDKPNIPDEIRAGKFREDLYYRLNVSLNTVALADRIDDIVPVATFLLHRHMKSVTGHLYDSAIDALRAPAGLAMCASWKMSYSGLWCWLRTD